MRFTKSNNALAINKTKGNKKMLEVKREEKEKCGSSVKKSKKNPRKTDVRLRKGHLLLKSLFYIGIFKKFRE